MRTTRRDFTKALTAAAALIAADVVAETTTPPAVANAQTELVRAEFGQFLGNDEIEKLRKDFAESAPLLQKFRDFKLKNSDEPDVAFAALVKRW